MTEMDIMQNEKDNKLFHVLDQGYVRLVDFMGSDLSIVRAARVSYDADWRSGDNEGSDKKLINYLMMNAHTSPFEAVTMTFEVKAPIFVIRQWHRHRTWSYNEVSARYTELPQEVYSPDQYNIGIQSVANKQMRLFDENENALDIVSMIDGANSISFDYYDQLLEKGCPRELARSVLPTGTYTRMFATVNLHNLFHFIKLRDHGHAQYEIQVYAQAIKELIKQHICPVAVEAFDDKQNM